MATAVRVSLTSPSSLNISAMISPSAQGISPRRTQTHAGIHPAHPPLVKESFLSKYNRLFPRPFFKMIPDTIIPADYIDNEDIREDGRIGFRITSMAFANLKNFPVSRIDEAYNLRKFYRKSSMGEAQRNIWE